MAKEESQRTVQLIEPDEGPLRSVDWSPDGTRLAIGDEQRGLWVWTIAGALVWYSATRLAKVNCVSWSPDGTRIVVASTSVERPNSSVQIFNASSGEVQLEIEESITLQNVAWSPCGKLLTSVSQNGSLSEVRLLDSLTGNSVHAIDSSISFAHRFAWSRQGDLAWSSTESGIKIWNENSGRPAKLGKNRLAYLSWSPEGRYLALSGVLMNEVEVWEIENQNCIHNFSVPNGGIASMAWSPSSLVLAGASEDGWIKLWGNKVGEEIVQLGEHTGPVSSVSFSPKGGRLASASSDGTVRIWDVEDVVPPGEYFDAGANDNESVTNEYVVRQAKTIGRQPRIHVKSNSAEEKPLWIPTNLPEQNEKCLGVFKYGDVGERKLNDFTSVCIMPGTSQAMTPSESNMNYRMFVGLGNGNLKCIDLQTGAELWTRLLSSAGNIKSLTASPDGKFIASSSDETGIARIWDAHTGETVLDYDHRSGLGINNIRWSPDGRFLATAGLDKFLKVWDSRNGKTVCEIEHANPVWGIAWSPNSKWLLSSEHREKNVSLWHPINGQKVRDFFGQGVSSNWGCWGIAWSPDGQQVAASGIADGESDRNIIVWNLEADAEQFRLSGHKGQIRNIEWSSDGRWIATAGSSDNDAIRVWDSRTGAERIRFGAECNTSWWDVSWSVDGAFLAGAENGYDIVRLWDTRELALEARRDAATSKEKESYSPVYGLPPKSAGGLRFNQSSATNDQSGDSGDVPSGPPLSSREARLIRGLGTMRSLHIHPPLSVIDDLVELLGGLDDQVGGAFGCLSVVEGMRKLVSLRWPRDARLGLAAFLLHEVPFTEEWTPPEDWSVDELSDTLFSALNGAEQVDPEVPFASLIHIKKSLDQVDDRLLTFLKILGPETVAKNPSILVMQRHRLPMIPATVTANHRWIGQHVSLHESGRSSGVSGGGTSSGIETRGRIQHVLPWQWLLDSDEFDYRYAQSDLLYRSFEGADPPKLRPTVILLDVSPPVFGPVEMITRPAADSVARTLLRHQLPVVLITTGVRQTGHEGYFELKSASDLLHIWTESTLEPANYGRALQLAQSAQRWLSTGSEPASILVFSHPWFGGSSRSNFPELSHLRGLFVQYPKHPHVQPSIHDLCEKWECLSPTVPDRLAGILGKLVG